MASVQRAMVLCMLMAAIGVTSAAVYKVGDSSGWTILGSPNYTQWAASKSFHVGDTLIFEYNKQFHNVLQVSHSEFQACNGTSPIATYATGNDTITIKKTGHYYFLCGFPGHCDAGQKVDIRVPRTSAVSAPPATSPSGSPSAVPPSVAASSPSPSAHQNGASPSSSKGVLGILGLALAFFAAFVSGFTY
ncbi:PREDICTED: mavicyanin [Nelumbo nucifera]|uniref:Phytocyanin domain-containing protein n=2 Tax=Nelumbo nucifera TaxID=4432 RepID=A0A822XK42_NELNU|nr:PREDICTED: mavicyanin [Nelumbo nucifera]DAD19501.1 TPA_asm: hypothetical protein HUJ06_020964 [Nelumbo nucifera]